MVGLVLTIILGIIFLVLATISIGCLYDTFTNDEIDDDYKLVFYFMSLLVGTFFIIGLVECSKPHYGDYPTMKDVPEKAHIDTITTIRGTDTTRTYEIVWNDVK